MSNSQLNQHKERKSWQALSEIPPGQVQYIVTHQNLTPKPLLAKSQASFIRHLNYTLHAKRDPTLLISLSHVPWQENPQSPNTTSSDAGAKLLKPPRQKPEFRDTIAYYKYSRQPLFAQSLLSVFCDKHQGSLGLIWSNLHHLASHWLDRGVARPTQSS